MHFMLSASSAHRWGECAASPIFEAQFPDVETPEAADGTASHWVAEQVLRSLVDPEQTLTTCGEYVGQTASNGIEVEQEMADGAAQYVTDVMRIANDHGAKRAINVESRLHAAMIHAMCGGTTDTWLYVPDLHRLYIWDYKFGHEVVEAEGNRQGVVYYAGLYDKLGLDGSTDQNLDVRIRIVQPRANHRDGTRREWKVTGGELRTYVNKLNHQARLAFGPDPKCVSGPHCLHCKATLSCQASATRTAAALSYINRPFKADMSTNDVGYELSMLDEARHAVKERLSALKQIAETSMDKGGVVPGWTREASQTAPKWTIPDSQIIAIATASGVNIEKRSAKTPLQAQTAGLNPDIITQFSKRGLSEPKLVRAEKTIAYKAFGKKD